MSPAVVQYRGGDNNLRSPKAHVEYLLRCADMWEHGTGPNKPDKEQAERVRSQAARIAREHGL